MRLFTMAFLGAALLVPGLARAEPWQIDPAHTTVDFAVKHMMITTVRGTFGKVSGTVDLNEKHPEKSRVDVTIDASTVDTRESKRDEHLKSEDFLWVKKHPNITFVSKQVKKAGKGKLKVNGDLTIRGITKPVTLLVEGPTGPQKTPYGATVRGASATTKINRKDFGLVWNAALEAGGVLVGDEVKITLDVQMVAPAVTTAKAAAQ